MSFPREKKLDKILNTRIVIDIETYEESLLEAAVETIKAVCNGYGNWRNTKIKYEII